MSKEDTVFVILRSLRLRNSISRTYAQKSLPNCEQWTCFIIKLIHLEMFCCIFNCSLHTKEAVHLKSRFSWQRWIRFKRKLYANTGISQHIKALYHQLDWVHVCIVVQLVTRHLPPARDDDLFPKYGSTTIAAENACYPVLCIR